MKGRALIAGFFLVAFLASAPAGLAQDCSDSPICQYIEEIPEAGGPSGGGSDGDLGGGQGSGWALSPGILDAIQTEGGSVAAILEEIATSPSRGAPEMKTGGSGPAGDGSDPLSSEPSAASAIGSAFTDEGGGELSGLAIALAAIGAIAVAAAVWRVRRGRA